MMIPISKLPRLAGGRVKWSWVFVVVALLAGANVNTVRAAAINPRQFNAIHSRSDQFVVTSPAPGVPSYGLTRRDFKYDPNALHLEAPALAVTCERVKEALLRELGATDQWRGKIYVALKPAALASPDVAIVPVQYADGWQYRLEIPDQIDAQFLLRRLVEVTLLEIANRSNPPHSTEIPRWLIEGFALHLFAADGQNLILQTRKLDELTKTVFPSTRLPDPFREARARLAQQNAVSFIDLSLPSPAHLSGIGWDNFRCSSQVFVNELLKFRDGRACLQNFLGLLPNYLNHQLAFLQAYQEHFHSLLDVEKWWSVAVVNFTGRDQQMKWSADVCLQRLDEILRAPVEIRAGTNTLPTRAELRIQNIFEKLDYARQKIVLQTVTSQLQQLQWNAPQDMFKLVKDYHAALISYVQRREKALGTTTDGKGQAGSAKIVIRDTIRQLELLDVIRDDFRNFAGVTTAQNTAK